METKSFYILSMETIENGTYSKTIADIITKFS